MVVIEGCEAVIMGMEACGAEVVVGIGCRAGECEDNDGDEVAHETVPTCDHSSIVYCKEHYLMYIRVINTYSCLGDRTGRLERQLARLG